MGLEPALLDDRGDVVGLVEPPDVRGGRERPLRLCRARVPEQIVGDADDGRRVEPAREAGPDRDVGAQAEADRVGEELPEPGAGVRVRQPAPLGLEVVPTIDGQGPVDLVDPGLDGLPAAQLHDAGEHGLVGVVQERVGEVVEGPLVVEASLPAREHRELLDLGGEREASPGREPVVERLDAEPVAGSEDRPGLPVEENEREHAVEPGEAVAAPLGVGVEHHLRVGAGGEGVPGGFELVPELAVVVDLAVVHDPVPAVGRAHGLVACGREVQDREATMTEREADIIRLNRRTPS